MRVAQQDRIISRVIREPDRVVVVEAFGELVEQREVVGCEVFEVVRITRLDEVRELVPVVALEVDHPRRGLGTRCDQNEQDQRQDDQPGKPSTRLVA